jgi:hypothetical protein
MNFIEKMKWALPQKNRKSKMDFILKHVQDTYKIIDIGVYPISPEYKDNGTNFIEDYFIEKNLKIDALKYEYFLWLKTLIWYNVEKWRYRRRHRPVAV